MFNLWLVVRDDAKQEINAALSTPPEDYQGPVPDNVRAIFELLSDLTVQKIFLSPDLGGNDYHMYSLYIDAGDAPTMQDDIDTIVTTYPNHIIIGGAWRFNDGSQVGGYPPHPQLLQMMPDVFDPGTQTFIPATVVADVNLLAGQAARDFS